MAKSLRVTIDTQETLTPETMAVLFGLKDKLGWFFFAEEKTKLPDQIDTAKLAPIQLEDNEKSPSQRLRAVLYVYFQQNPPATQPDDFELYYRRWMEKAITQIKQQLL